MVAPYSFRFYSSLGFRFARPERATAFLNLFQAFALSGRKLIGIRLPRVPLRLPWAKCFWPFRPYPSISETLGFIIVSLLRVTAMMLICCQMMLSLCRTVAHFVQKWCKVSAETQVYLQSMPNRSPFSAKIVQTERRKSSLLELYAEVQPIFCKDTEYQAQSQDFSFFLL